MTVKAAGYLWIVGIVASAGIVLGTPGRACAAPDRVIRIGVHDEPPFAIKKGDQWSGISIELLRAVAEKMHATVEVHDLTPEQITSGPIPDVDVVATLVEASKMNARYELSHAFYATGLSIAVPEPKKESLVDIVGRSLSARFVLIVAGVVGALMLVGLLMFWFEKRHVEPLPKEKQALSKALFWAFEPVIGYKASQHATRAGRLLGTIWGLFGVVMVSGLTANLAAQLTARRLDTSIHGPADLPRFRVGVIEHTAGRKFCDRRGIPRQEFPDLEHALAALEQGKLDAVVDDAPDLQYALHNGHPHVTIVPGTFYPVFYTFGLVPDSSLRREFNAALLEVAGSDAWPSMLATYLGKAE
jgi:ABC-type amino acid transport substrate-binding protein